MLKIFQQKQYTEKQYQKPLYQQGLDQIRFEMMKLKLMFDNLPKHLQKDIDGLSQEKRFGDMLEG